MDQTATGKFIMKKRKELNLTQEQLAKLLGIERNHVSNVELAKAGVSLDVIFRMAGVLEIPVHKLFEFRD